MKNAMKSRMVYGTLMFGILVAGLFACGDKSAGTSRLEVRMTDAPADYQEVNVDIQGVQVNSQTGDPATGWQSLTISKGVYNLLKFSNGLDTLLGHVDLPAGHVSQIRLVLGTNNSVKINGVTTALSTPSAQQSGLKLQINTDLKEGITYKILLDFDAARSIVSTGSGKFNLKPVIRTITTAQDGAIKGIVNPMASAPAIYAITGTDTVSTFAGATGGFLVHGLGAGTYRLVFVPKAGYQTKEITNVAVSINTVTDVGTVSLN